MAEKKVIELEIRDNVSSLKSQLRQATAEVALMAEKFGATSKEAADAAKRAAELKDMIGDAKDLTDAFNPDAKFNALSSSIGGVLNGFQAYEGALGLIGVESESLQKTMLKVQSAMALSQGLQGVLEAKDNFIQLGAVVKNAFAGMTQSTKIFLASGIGLLLVAVTGLIVAFGSLKEAFSTALSKAIEFERTTSLQAETARKAVENFGEYERTLKRLGYTEDEISEKRRKRFKEAIEKTKAEIEASKAVYKEQLKNLETVQSFDKFGLNATGRALYGDEEEARKQREKVKTLREQLEKLKNDQFQFEAEIKAKRKQNREEEQKKREEEIQKEKDAQTERLKVIKEKLKNELDAIRGFYKDAKQANEARLRTDQEQEEFQVTSKYSSQIALFKKHGKDTSELEIAQLNELNDIRLKYQKIQEDKEKEKQDKINQIIEEAKKNREQLEFEFNENISKLQDLNTEAKLTEAEKEKRIVEEKYFALEQRAKGNAEQEKIIAEAKARELDAIDKNSKDKQIERENQLRQTRLQLAGSAFSALGELVGSFNMKNEKDAKKQFEIQKAFNLAAAITNTAMAVTGALTAGGNPIKLATGQQFVEAGIAGAVGLANIVKIASAKFDGGNSYGNTSTTTPSGGQSYTPQFNVVGSSGVNQLAQVQQQPVKAYITSGDVVSAMSLERNKLQKTSI